MSGSLRLNPRPLHAALKRTSGSRRVIVGIYPLPGFDDGAVARDGPCARSHVFLFPLTLFFPAFEFRPPLQPLRDFLLVSKPTGRVEASAPEHIGQVLLWQIGVG